MTETVFFFFFSFFFEKKGCSTAMRKSQCSRKLTQNSKLTYFQSFDRLYMSDSLCHVYYTSQPRKLELWEWYSQYVPSPGYVEALTPCDPFVVPPYLSFSTTSPIPQAGLHLVIVTTRMPLLLNPGGKRTALLNPLDGKGRRKVKCYPHKGCLMIEMPS